jgi:hypothetical protein
MQTELDLKKVFIVGCPRSGSTWLSSLLGAHPEIAVHQHTKIFTYLNVLRHWWLIKEDFANSGCGTFERSDQMVKKKQILSEEDLFELCRTFANKLFGGTAKTGSGITTVVDKTPENVHLASFILKTFPDAYFLHIVRDPRSVFSSLRAAGLSWAKYDFPTRADDGAKFWKSEVEAGQKIQDLTPNYKQVSYEALMTNGPTELAEVFSFLNLPFRAEFCRQAIESCQIEKLQKQFNNEMPKGFFRQGKHEAWKQELSSLDIRIIEYIATDLMKALGYSLSLKPSFFTRPQIRLRAISDQMVSRGTKFIERTLARIRIKWVGRDVNMPECVVYNHEVRIKAK